MKSSQYYRESMIALKSGLLDRYWELDNITKAWIIALIETKDTLQEIVDYVDGVEDEK